MNPTEFPKFESLPEVNLNNTNPNSTDSGMPNRIDNAPRLERESSVAQKVAARSRKTRRVANTIIRTRQDFKIFLQSKQLDLFTSAVEFQKTGSFLESSYVVYPKNGGLKEPLRNFLQRYPQLTQVVNQINDSLKGLQNEMQVSSNPQF